MRSRYSAIRISAYFLFSLLDAAKDSGSVRVCALRVWYCARGAGLGCWLSSLDMSRYRHVQARRRHDSRRLRPQPVPSTKPNVRNRPGTAKACAGRRQMGDWALPFRRPARLGCCHLWYKGDGRQPCLDSRQYSGRGDGNHVWIPVRPELRHFALPSVLTTLIKRCSMACVG